MALSDLTFKLWTDSDLTIAFSGDLALDHETDLSDNPQDTQLFFGSDEADGTRQLEATSNPGVANISITPTFILDDWAAATAYTEGDWIIPTTPNGYKYKCSTSGISHASTEPTWPTSIGSTVVDNTCVWTCVGAVHPITEVKLATTEAGLDSATGGAALNIGTTILSGATNAVEVWVRVTNTNTFVNDNSGFPELALYINEVIETDV